MTREAVSHTKPHALLYLRAMPATFNNRLRQIVLLLLIAFLAILLVMNLLVFVPGFLGAITLYILLRERFFQLTEHRKWNRTLTSLLFVFASLILIGIPVLFSFELLAQKAAELLNNQDAVLQTGKAISNKLRELTGYEIFNDNNLKVIQQKAAVIIPSLINSTANLVSNFAIMFFLFYYLLLLGKETEQKLNRYIPLKAENINVLGKETRNMIRANAIGIPVMATIQGLVATLGYAVFGIRDYFLWGFLTGICSMIPLVGTGLIWVPLTLYLLAAEQQGYALGLLLYAVIILTNIDYVARITLLKKLIDVHPLLTIFGVICGISLFGFWGVIFGPLLISYLIILIKIYFNEFVLNDQSVHA